MQERRHLSVRLTPEAREGWDRFCAAQGMTLTTILEQLGLQLLAGDDAWVPTEAVTRARQQDRARYSRRPE